MQISAKTRLVCLIVALVFEVCALVGTGTYLIINHINNANALKGGSSLGDIISSENSAFVDYDTYEKLMDRLGDRTGGATTLENGGTPIVFEMAGEEWQVVYRDPANADIITVWMTEPYTTSVFGSNDTYSSSTVRTTVNNYYTTRVATYTAMSSFIRTPSQMSSTYKSAQGQQYTTSGYTSDQGALGGSENFWLPSLYEAFSLWGLDANDRGFDDTSVASYCWLRSGSTGGSSLAMHVDSSGSTSRGGVSNSLGVRPAAHLSLSALANNTITININANIESNLSSYIQLDNSLFTGTAGNTYNTPQIFTYTGTNYYITQLTINETTVNYSNIPTSAGSFQSGNGFEYRVYRNENRSICYVQLQNVSTDVTITATQASPTIDISIENNAVTINSFDRATLDTTTATIYAQQNMAYTQRFRLPGQNWVDISTTASGDGFVGDIHYSYTTTNNVITLYFENLTAGEVFEITLGGEEKPLAYSAVGGSATFSEFIDNEGYTNVVIAPQAGYYVHSIIVDNVAFNVEYYRAEIMGAGNARIIGYTVKDTNNMLDLWLVGQYAKSTIVFNLVQGTPPDYKTPSTGGAVTGTVVTATNGGEARIVGFDYDNTTDDENVTFIAVNYTGYAFSGWSVDGEILDGYGMSASIPYTLVKDKIVTAVFTPISNNNANDSTDNNFDDMI